MLIGAIAIMSVGWIPGFIFVAVTTSNDRGHVQRIAPIQGLLGTAVSLPVFIFAPTPLLWPLALASPLLIAMLIWSVYAGARRTFQRGT